MPYVEVWVEPEDCDCKGILEHEARKIAALLDQCAHDLDCDCPPRGVADRLRKIADEIFTSCGGRDGEDHLMTPADTAYLAWKKEREKEGAGT